ncbi:MAG TPA: thiosulfate oxidation carrier protein SoxY [Oceanospirillaceae bacterium]|nr:thiosulfate oxidation carrier protein SoxY [Oceanospirillaceae bacterium]
MISRRSVLKAVFTGGAIAGLGVMMPKVALAAWNKTAFDTDNQDTAMGALYDSAPAASAEVNLKAPDIAENGAVVPVTVSSSMSDVKSIAVFVEGNPNPLAAQFMIPAGTKAEVSCRIRMGKTSAVTAVVETASGLFSASKEVKVTIGGCGG